MNSKSLALFFIFCILGTNAIEINEKFDSKQQDAKFSIKQGLKTKTKIYVSS